MCFVSPLHYLGFRTIKLNKCVDLLHEVSVRSSTNRMDAANLALCFTPNLVAGPNIMKDIQMCSIPGVSSTTVPTASILPPSSSSPQDKNFLSQSKRKEPMTLGVLIQVCIEQYYEIFEELPDRTNVSGLPSHPSLALSSTLPPSSSYGTAFTGTTAASHSALSSGVSSPSGYGTPLEHSILSEFPPTPEPQSTPARVTASTSTYRTPLPVTSVPTSPDSSISFTTAEDSDDEDPDESVLIMPLGPSESTSPISPPRLSNSAVSSSPAPPSAWSTSGVGIGHPSSPLSAPRNKHRRKESALSTQTAQSATGTSSTLSEAARYSGPSGGTLRTARSIISIDNGKAGPGGAPGSIKLGRASLSIPGAAGGGAGGTIQRRTSGAGVEAVGVTASGFFSPVSPERIEHGRRVSEENDLD